MGQLLVQCSEMIRAIARDVRDLRATRICTVVSDGPISAQSFHSLLQKVQAEARE